MQRTPLVVLTAVLLTVPNLGTRSTTGRIEGHVRDQGGTPVEAAEILVEGTSLSTLSDKSGAYALTNVPGGSYTVVARRLGYAPTRVVGVRVTSDSTTTLDISLQSSSTSTSLEAITINGAAVPRLSPGVVTSSPRALERRQGSVAADESWRWQRQPGNREQYSAIDENPFLAVSAHELSTFSIDVDRASYSNVRRFLMQGRLPPRDAVRIEELVNYFPYAYGEPDGDAPFAVHAEVAPAPWKPQHRLVRIGLQARRLTMDQAPPSNLVFLIDVSGSMQPPNKLPLVVRSMGLLVSELRARDRVAIVVYAGSAGLVLPSTSGDHKEKILEAIDRLEAGGSTAGGAGIRRAYDEAVANYIRGGNNRVILATDGDFNVGVPSDAEMIRLIEEKRKTGVFLTVLGFGEGNLQDAKMEQIADHGNGNYAYIDNLMEARKTLVHELGGTLFTVAKDVKIQVEFNPARVRAYRLIGYENRLLADEDFADDTKDAGEVGAGHSVTALYEIIPVGVESDVTVRTPDSLRYQSTVPSPRPGPDGGELLFVKIRYKQPDGDTSRLLSRAVSDRVAATPSAEFRFQAAVAEFGLLLRESPHRGSADVGRVIAAARASLGADSEGYRAEFIRMVQAAQSIGLKRPPGSD